MANLHEFLSGLQVHKSHYSRGHSPRRQYTDPGFNTTRIWKDYVSQFIRDDKDTVTLNVFRNVFNRCYNISTRYVLSFLFSNTLKLFVDINNLMLRSTHCKN